VFLDSAYIAKYYVNESDSEAVRRLIHGADSLVSSEWAVVEVASAFHRHLREGHLTVVQYRALLSAFQRHLADGFWSLIPLDSRLIRRLGSLLHSLPGNVFLRAGDAIQLISAQDAGEREVWTNDRRMLAAAAHFGLTARSA
jgi:predicted nucleic acid-binding protein